MTNSDIGECQILALRPCAGGGKVCDLATDLNRVSPMNTLNRTASLRAFAAVLGFAMATVASAQQENLPVYTSPIDVTQGVLRIQIEVPQSGLEGPRQVPLPVEGLQSMARVLGTPLGVMFDRYWNSPTAPGQLSPRQEACDGPEGVIRQVQDQTSGLGRYAYDIVCQLGATGKVFSRIEQGRVLISYQITSNVVEFRSTSSLTCTPNRGALCPNDPKFRITFMSEIVATLDTDPNNKTICGLRAGQTGAVNLHAVSFSSTNASSALAMAYDSLVNDHRFSGGARAMQAATRNVPLPLDAAFTDLRTLCANPSQPVMQGAVRLGNVGFSIGPVQDIVISLPHPGQHAPWFLNSETVVGGLPSFERPTLAVQPVVAAGGTLEVRGRFFPPVLDPTTLILMFDRSATAACNGGATELSFGPNFGATRTIRLPAGGAASSCSSRHILAGLTPATTYRLNVRDCDGVKVCSAWSPEIRLMTPPATSNPPVILTMGNGVTLGSTSTDASGNFIATATIPANTAPGAQLITASSGSASASVSVQVTRASGTGSARIILTGSFYGDTGCPTRPLPDYAQKLVVDDQFSLFGTGFQQGLVLIRLDSPTGIQIGSVIAKADGTFCSRFQSPAAPFLGPRKLFAVQDGLGLADLPVEVIRRAIVR